MASKKLTIANNVRTSLIADIASISESNAKLVIGGALSVEMLNDNVYTFVISPLERVPNVTMDRCGPTWVYQVGVGIFKKLTTQDLNYLMNAAGETELDEIDEISESIEDYLYNKSYAGYSFSEIETDMQLDPVALENGFFRHTMMISYTGE